MGAVTEGILALGQSKVLQGDAAAAWCSAQEALGAARARADRHQEARALVLLARAATLDSRFRSAYSLAMESGRLFDCEADGLASADAQLVASYAAASLGMSDISLSVAECARGRLGPADSLRSAEALNYTGVAAFWQQDYHRSASALEAALVCASASFTAPAAFQPLVNRAFCEMLRATAPDAVPEERRDKLELLSVQLERLIVANRTESLSAACPRIALLLARVVRSVVALTRGRQVQVEMHLAAFERDARFLPVSHWVHALPWLVRCVAHRQAGDLPAALRAAREMLTTATRGEHASLERLAAEHWTAVAVSLDGSPTIHRFVPRA
jgi:hypothetical protein